MKSTRIFDLMSLTGRLMAGVLVFSLTLLNASPDAHAAPASNAEKARGEVKDKLQDGPRFDMANSVPSNGLVDFTLMKGISVVLLPPLPRDLVNPKTVFLYECRLVETSSEATLVKKAPVHGAIDYNARSGRLTFTPDGELAKNARYVFAVDPGRGKRASISFVAVCGATRPGKGRATHLPTELAAHPATRPAATPAPCVKAGSATSPRTPPTTSPPTRPAISPPSPLATKSISPAPASVKIHSRSKAAVEIATILKERNARRANAPQANAGKPSKESRPAEKNVVNAKDKPASSPAKRGDFEILSVWPEDGTFGVPDDAAPEIVFSRPFDPKSLNKATVRMSVGGRPLPIELLVDTTSCSVKVKPVERLVSLVKYSLEISNAIESEEGERLKKGRSVAFNCGTEHADEFQIVEVGYFKGGSEEFFDPSTGDSELARGSIVVTFNRPLSSHTLDESTLFLTDGANILSSRLWLAADRRKVLVELPAREKTTGLLLVARSEIRDEDGGSLEGELFWEID
jgi:hypothetical protein